MLSWWLCKATIANNHRECRMQRISSQAKFLCLQPKAVFLQHWKPKGFQRPEVYWHPRVLNFSIGLQLQGKCHQKTNKVLWYWTKITPKLITFSCILNSDALIWPKSLKLYSLVACRATFHLVNRWYSFTIRLKIVFLRFSLDNLN